MAVATQTLPSTAVYDSHAAALDSLIELVSLSHLKSHDPSVQVVCNIR